MAEAAGDIMSPWGGGELLRVIGLGPWWHPQGTWAALWVFGKRTIEGEREGSVKSPVNKMEPSSSFFEVCSLQVKVGLTVFPR